MSEILELFIGMGGLAILLTAAYFLAQLGRCIRDQIDKEEKYEFIEGLALKKTAVKHGLDYDLAKQEEQARNSKTFRKAIQEDMIKDYFDNKNNKK